MRGGSTFDFVPLFCEPIGCFTLMAKDRLKSRRNECAASRHHRTQTQSMTDGFRSVAFKFVTQLLTDLCPSYPEPHGPAWPRGAAMRRRFCADEIRTPCQRRTVAYFACDGDAPGSFASFQPPIVPSFVRHGLNCHIINVDGQLCVDRRRDCTCCGSLKRAITSLPSCRAETCCARAQA
jgi:hypothetical protein